MNFTQEEVRPGSTLYCGDCLDVLRTLPAESVNSVVTDPPAGISFMGKEWDHNKGGRDFWIAWMQEVAAECLRVLKPGGHALVWALPRTSHWTATAWENAGFEVRDRVSHIFGSGFPKSLDIGKQIDKEAGAEREVVGIVKKAQSFTSKNNSYGDDKDRNGEKIISSPSTPEPQAWTGWGTALKPAVEDWWLFRKPCEEKTVAANVLKYGTGALNIDACRIPAEPYQINKLESWSGFGQEKRPEYAAEINDKGRWPAHLVLDGSKCVVDQFPVAESGKPTGKRNGIAIANAYGKESREPGTPLNGYGDTGSTARFFACCSQDEPSEAIFLYTPKPTQEERNFGVNGPAKDPASVTDFRPTLKSNPENWESPESPYMRTTPKKNNHPTVKSQSLMTWLIRLITPLDGVVLDAFMGSGSTGVASVTLGCPFIGIEQDLDYFQIAKMRILAAQAPLFPLI